MKKILILVTLINCFITSCSTEFKGYSRDGKRLINYKLFNNRIEWGPKEVFVKNLSTERTTEYNVECEYSCVTVGLDGLENDYCDGHQKFVTYEYKENVYRKELKLKGGRIIHGQEYTKEEERIIDQAECI